MDIYTIVRRNVKLPAAEVATCTKCVNEVASPCQSKCETKRLSCHEQCGMCVCYIFCPVQI